MSNLRVGKAWPVGLSGSRVVETDSSGDPVASAVTAAELAVLDGITSTTAELNILDGTTITASQLNTLILAINPEGGNFELEGVPSRLHLRWVAGEHGKPGINADILNASEAVRMITDPDFEVVGTNASSDDVVRASSGLVTFTTDGALNDSVILAPLLDADQSSWNTADWRTDKQVRWGATLYTFGSVADVVLWAGLKLTNTDTIITDDDQVFLRGETAADANWQAIDSIGGSDTTTDSGVAFSPNTRYFFYIDIASDRTARMWINGTLVRTTAALTNTTALIPYIGIKATAVAGKSVNVANMFASRVY